MGSTQTNGSYLEMTLSTNTAVAEGERTFADTTTPATEEIPMDSQNALQSAALRQHSLNMMAALAQATQATALPFLSAAAGVQLPNAVAPTATFVNFPVTAGTSTTTLEQYAATQPLVYPPNAYLTAQSVCSCGCSAQTCPIHHRYTTPAFLAATTLATALENQAASTARLHQQQQQAMSQQHRHQVQQQQSSTTPSLSTLSASSVNVNIPPPMAQLPPAPLNLPALPPTIRMGSSRTLKRPAPYQVSQSQASQSSHGNHSNGSSATSQDSTASGIRAPKLRRVASFDNPHEANNSHSRAIPSHNESSSQPAGSNGSFANLAASTASLLNSRTAVELVDMAASIDSVLQSTAAQAQSIQQTQYPPCTICAGCQTRLPPHPTCGCHHHHHCVNHHTICAMCSAASQNYSSSSSGSSMATVSNAAVVANAAYMAGISNAAQVAQATQNSLAYASLQRQAEINPMHSTLLAQRQAQQERDQQNSNLFYRNQLNQSLIGFDVVPRRLPQPVIMVPRVPTMMDLSIFVLHPTAEVLSNAAGIQATHQHANSEPQPVGATLDQINKYTSVVSYNKDPEQTENETERCTICLCEFEENEEVRSLPCQHIFHSECIVRWNSLNRRCPICRLDIVEGGFPKADKAGISGIVEATIPSHSSQYTRTQ